jgi:putative FmdB family regulatory protein
MPTYEYRRPDGSTFELLQSITDEPLTQDPETGEPVQRVLHAPAVHFKGSGFYNTDYGTRKRQRETKAAAEGSSSKKSESKSSDSSSSSSSSSGSSSSGSSSSGSSSSGSSSSGSSSKD